MITIKLLSPEIIKFDKEIYLCKLSHQIYIDNRFGVSLPVNFSLFMSLTEKDSEGKIVLPVDYTGIFSKDVVFSLQSVKSIIGQCTQLSEVLFGRLKNINDRLRQISVLNDFFNEFPGDVYNKLDFMKHRNLLSSVLKSQKLENLNDLSKEYNIKSVTTSFYNFILDRNKYTHGELMYWYPRRLTLLEYEHEERKCQYGLVNTDILNSFLACYKELDEFLSHIDKNLS